MSPAAWGFTFLLYTKERVNYRHAALFSYMGKYGVQHRGVGGLLDGPCHDLVIMACLVPEQWQLRVQWLTVVSSDGLEEAVDGDPYGIQWQVWRRPVPACLTAPEWL
jgi:hypothetical protein